MTLTPNDLQAIGNLVDQKLRPIKQDLSTLKTDVDSLKKAVKPLKSMQKTLNSVKKTVDFISGQYDKRLCHLEQHTSHPPHNVDFASAFTPAFAS